MIRAGLAAAAGLFGALIASPPIISPVAVSPDDAAESLEAQADRLERVADRASGDAPAIERDYGRVVRTWLAPGQRLAERCDLPTASLSAVAREGELAFVSVGLTWAPPAGHGETWVMERTARG